jgi:DNA-binding NarL/FixJ family response regulator
MRPKILIVDDHEIVREGIRTLLNRSRPDWPICGDAASGAEAIQSVERLNPDVVVLDITMPGMSGLEAAPRIRQSNPKCRIIIFTMHQSGALEADVRSAGAHGFVLKSEAAQNLVLAIETVFSSGEFFGKPSPGERGNDEQSRPGIAFWATLGLKTLPA